MTIFLHYGILMGNTTRYVCFLFSYLFEVIGSPKPIYKADLFFFLVYLSWVLVACLAFLCCLLSIGAY